MLVTAAGVGVESGGMIDQTTAIFCLVDDVLQALGWQEDPRRQTSDAEVITTALAAAFFFGGNQAKARAALHQTRLVPAMLGPSRFCRRLHAVGALIERVFIHLGLALKAASASPRYLLDSFPVPLCDNIRTKRCRLVPLNEAFRGKNASKRRFFYGVRVVLLLTEGGAPVEFAFLPGAAFDVRAYNQLPLCLPPGSEVYADAAYSSEEIEALATEHEGVDLQICLRVTNRRRQSPALEARKHLLRHPVEAAFSGRHIHAVTFRGFQLKVLLFVLAHTLRKGFAI